MGPIQAVVREVMAKTPVIPVATASKDGVPNVAPMVFVRALDDSRLVVADQFMNKAAKNLAENPRLALCVWDTEGRQAYQIKGRAEVVTEGAVFDDTVSWVSSAMPQLTTKAAVIVTVEHVFVCQPGPDLGKDLAGCE